jgi:hypothetical protein
MTRLKLCCYVGALLGAMLGVAIYASEILGL